MTFAQYELENFGYKVQTTFWEDFSIAERFGLDAIKDTYRRAFEEWKDNVVYVTELVLVLNVKCWDKYNKGRVMMSKVYSDLYYECSGWCNENLKGDDYDYYFRITD